MPEEKGRDKMGYERIMSIKNYNKIQLCVIIPFVEDFQFGYNSYKYILCA